MSHRDESDFHAGAIAEFGTVRDFQTWLIDNDLVISLGDGREDEFAVTPRGVQLWRFLELCRMVEP